MTGTVEPALPYAVDVRHLILDRDGVLNEEAPAQTYVTGPDGWHWIAGSLEALALIAGAGIRVSIVTNQSGVGRGLMTPGDLDAVHGRMMRESESAGGHIDALFACPHAPDTRCNCRKPAPGLIEAAVAASGIPAAQTLAVGDDERDIEAAHGAGVAAALVLTGKGRAAASSSPRHAVPVYDDLASLARALLADSPGTGND
ncbi:MAG: HAD-IIIA family hydrolase [Steroidobacteraceae bacterium]